MRWWVAAVLVGLLAVGGAALLLRQPADEPVPVEPAPLSSLAPGADSAQDYARAACTRIRLVQQGIQADAAAETVRRELAAARALAGAALRRDGQWARLSGGIAALDEAVRTDDPGAAGTALQVLLAECAAT